MRISIVGLGVLGTSLGLALKSATKDIPITGHDPDVALVSRAKHLGAIDHSHWNLISACCEADLVVLDLPFQEIAPTLTALCDDLKEGAVILDTAPLNMPVIEMAHRVLREGTAFVGGHVVAPALGLGQPEPSADLLRDAIFHLSIPEQVPAEAAEVAVNFAMAVGATPHFVDALEHDGLAAVTAQLPLLGALALANVIERAPGGKGRAEFVGAELTTLGAMLGGERAQPAEALCANGSNLLPWLDGYIEELGSVRALLAAGDNEGLAALVAVGRESAGRWSPQAEAETEPRPPSTVSVWRSLFLGGLGRSRRPPRD